MVRRVLSSPLKTFCVILVILLAAAFMPALAPKAAASSKKPVKSYKQAVRRYYREHGKESRFRLIDIDGQGSKELMCDNPGYYVTLYTKYHKRIHRLMNDYSYGAGGNGGYYYIPGKNLFSGYLWNVTDHDQYFMRINSNHTKLLCSDLHPFNKKKGPIARQKGSGYRLIIGKYKKNQILKQLKK